MADSANPRRHYLPHIGGHGYKVFIAYPHNPEGYVYIEPPDERQILLRNPGMSREQTQAHYLRECRENEERQEKVMKCQAKLVYSFATFLEMNTVAVAYDQLLADVGSDNIMKWSQEQINDSDFVILIITQSFRELLWKDVPHTEPIFSGDYLFNLINDPPKPLIPVFLNRGKDHSLLEQSMRMVTSYEILEPFDVSRNQSDDFQALYARLTKQDRYATPQPPVGGPVNVQKSSSLFSRGAPHRSKMTSEQNHQYQALSTIQQPVTDDILYSIAQTKDFYIHWKSLAKLLEVSEAEVVRIEESNRGDRSEMCLGVLNAWRGRKQDKAVISNLAKASMQTGNFVMIEVLSRVCIPE